MSTEKIRAYANSQMPDLDEKIAPLVALSARLSKMPVTKPELKRLLDEIETVLVALQNVYDRCCERFPDAEADGKPDPQLASLRNLIHGWHLIWEGWNSGGRAAVLASDR